MPTTTTPFSRMNPPRLNPVNGMVRHRRPFGLVGQEPGSDDCGYFCGYVLAMLYRSRGEWSRMSMSQADVYEARDRFRRIFPSTMEPANAPLGLHGEVGQFISALGAPGYRTWGPRRGLPMDAQTLRKAIDDAFDRPPSAPSVGVIVAISNGAAGHFVAIIGSQEGTWAIYDPAGNGRGEYVGVGSADEIATALAKRNATYLVIPERPAGPHVRIHIVVRGDTLGKISKKYYGKSSLYRVIHEANRSVIGPNPDKVYPGQRLVIPPR